MCHTRNIAYFGETLSTTAFSAEVDGLKFGGGGGRQIAVMPDIYGLTDFYRGYASYLAKQGATVWLTNPWAPFGDLSEVTREAAYERRHKLKDREHCDRLEEFVRSRQIDALVGFCIGGNFAFELARRGYDGTNIAIYPLPWGMENRDPITPAFEYLPELARDVTILMGEADHLAGPDNIRRLNEQASGNDRLRLHLYPGSNHGFFTDVDGEDERLKINARDGIELVDGILFGRDRIQH